MYFTKEKKNIHLFNDNSRFTALEIYSVKHTHTHTLSLFHTHTHTHTHTTHSLYPTHTQQTLYISHTHTDTHTHTHTLCKFVCMSVFDTHIFCLNGIIFIFPVYSLTNCSITEEGFSSVASALRSNPSHMRELWLEGNKAGDSGVKHLS